MNLRDVFTSKAIALSYTTEANGGEPYLGAGFFTDKKKAGLDLKWIKGRNGLPVSLMPSAFDAKSTFRDRVGISFNETEMPFFRESMLVKEADEQEIMRVKDTNDPYAQQVLDRIFDDTKNLVDGANVVPERMRMQLLAPLGGSVGINISANGVAYTYNYDPDGSWKAAHYAAIASAQDMWNAPATCDPLKNIEDAMDAQEAASGNRPAIALMSKATFNMIKNSEKVRGGILAQNVTANVNYTSAKVKQFVEEELSLTLIVYNKKFKDETGAVKAFFPDNLVMLLPNGTLGSTWYGTTPEEVRGAQSGADVSIVNTGVAVTVSTTVDPVNTKCTVSEIVLPSFENLDLCYALEVVTSGG